MKNMPLFFIALTIIISMGANSSCMENNNNIGTIDTLMIARSLSQQGYKVIRADIRNHQFKTIKSTETTPSHYVKILTPYRITHHCSKDKNSALSEQVFNKIDTIKAHKMTLQIKNQFNQHRNAIDECTQYKSIKNSNNVKITATFYDKKALIKALNEVHKHTAS